ncbi:MAG: hypothetical protein J0L61_05385 [Planctomycetes bacterium]|nr:hypothetical protein [Planctomycetota bacterium]
MNAPTNPTGTDRASATRVRDTALWVIAALLAMNLVKENSESITSEALAQRTLPEAYGVPNASEQRARMIKSLEDMAAKMQSLEQKLDKGGFEVKVTSMPKVELVQ